MCTEKLHLFELLLAQQFHLIKLLHASMRLSTRLAKVRAKPMTAMDWPAGRDRGCISCRWKRPGPQIGRHVRHVAGLADVDPVMTQNGICCHDMKIELWQ